MAIMACHSVEDLLIPPPETGAAQTLIFDLDDGRYTVAIDLREADGPLVNVFDVEPSRVDALLYGLPIETLGIPTGPVGAPNAQRSCRLSSPTGALRFEEGEWRTVEPSPALLERLIEPTLGCVRLDRCRPMNVIHHRLPSPTGAMLHLRDGPDTAVVATLEAVFVRVTPDGTELLPELDGLPQHAAARTEDGEIWLGGPEGNVARGTLASGFVVEQVMSPEETVTSLAARGGGDQQEVLAVTLAGLFAETSTVRLYRHHQDRWALLHEEPLPRVFFHVLRVSWFGDEALVSTSASLALRWDGETVTTFRLDTFSAGRIFTFAELGGQIYAGGGDGNLHLRSDDTQEWRVVPGSQLGAAVEGLSPGFGGLVFGGNDGLFRQFHVDSVSCDTTSVTRGDAERIFEYENGLWVHGGKGRDDGAFMNWVTVDVSQ